VGVALSPSALLGHWNGQEMKRAYADIKEGQIHYCADGHGEPLLLLHQVPLSSDEYALVIPTLAEEYRVVALDTPGYGYSDKVPRKYQIEDYARATISFFDALGIKKTSIVGHHTGAAIAVEVAVAEPERVDKLVLSGCPYYEDKTREMLLQDQRFQPLAIKEDGSHLLKLWRLVKSISPNSTPEVWNRVVAQYLKAGEYAEDGHQAVFRYRIEDRLRLIRSPTLVLSGSRDLFFRKTELVARMIPRSKVKVIEGGGVWLGYEMPEEFAKAVLEFLRD